jgi:hypothetical protein
MRRPAGCWSCARRSRGTRRRRGWRTRSRRSAGGAAASIRPGAGPQRLTVTNPGPWPAPEALLERGTHAAALSAFLNRRPHSRTGFPTLPVAPEIDYSHEPDCRSTSGRRASVGSGAITHLVPGPARAPAAAVRRRPAGRAGRPRMRADPPTEAKEPCPSLPQPSRAAIGPSLPCASHRPTYPHRRPPPTLPTPRPAVHARTTA